MKYLVRRDGTETTMPCEATCEAGAARVFALWDARQSTDSLWPYRALEGAKLHVSDEFGKVATVNVSLRFEFDVHGIDYCDEPRVPNGEYSFGTVIRG